jgi:hypothetical protein
MATGNVCKFSLFENYLYVTDQEYYGEHIYLHTITFSIEGFNLKLDSSKVKVKVPPITGHEGPQGE